MQKQHFIAKDIIGILIFLITVLVGAFLINALVFRSFSVTGPSMEPTLFTGDRLIVNRLPLTWSAIIRKPWVPQRGEVVVFENPSFRAGQPDRYLVKRVIGLPGEKVEIKEGRLIVYNNQNPDGFNPDLEIDGPVGPTNSETNVDIPSDHIFVAGDHRNGSFSFDSRNGLGTIPLTSLQGPVSVRIFPFTQLKVF